MACANPAEISINLGYSPSFQSPSGRFIWETIDHAIPYVGKGKSHQRDGEPS